MRWRGMDEAKPEQHATLKEALDERRTMMQQYVPADTQALHRRVVEQPARDRGRGLVPETQRAPGHRVGGAAIRVTGPQR